MFRHADVVCLCVHPVAVLNAAFCMACSLLILLLRVIKLVFSICPHISLLYR